MKQWKLKDLIKIHNGRDHKHLAPGSIPVYGSGGVMRFVDQKLCSGSSILLPRKGSLDNIMLVHGDFWTVDTMFYSTVNLDRADPHYLSEYLKHLDLSRLNTGSAVPSMTASVYYNIPILLPSLSDQKQIGSFIASLDAYLQKVEEMIQELEQTAREIYDYWFVQCDFPDEKGHPYRTSGGRMVWDETLKRDIPEGWTTSSLYSIADFINGLACQKHRPDSDDAGLPVIKIKEMTDGLSGKTERVSSSIPAKYVVSLGDILFSWSATLIVQRWDSIDAGLNQHIFKVKPAPEVGEGYLYLLLQQVVDEFVAIAMARKTTMGHITQDHLRAKMVVLPPDVIRDSFEKMYDPLLQQWKTLKLQRAEIIKLRIVLLPLLLNGQVSFSSSNKES